MQVQVENRDGVALIQFDDGKKNVLNLTDSYLRTVQAR